MRNLVIQAQNTKEAFREAKSIIGEKNWSYAGIPVDLKACDYQLLKTKREKRLNVKNKKRKMKIADL